MLIKAVLLSRVIQTKGEIMTAAIQSTQGAYQSTQAQAIDQSLSQRVGLLLKRAGVEIKGEGPLELSLNSKGEVVVSGKVDNKEELLAALGSDSKVKNLLKASAHTATQDAQSTADTAAQTIAGITKQQLSDIWNSLKSDPDGSAKLEKILSKLQVLEAFGQKYTGEVTADGILASNSSKDYYRSLASSMQASTPSMMDYLSEDGNSGSGSLLDYLNNSNSGTTDQNSPFNLDSSAAVTKAYNLVSQQKNGAATSKINLDA